MKGEAVQPSTIPANEPERLAAVRRYDILDTPPDGAFDRITALAARRFRVPISIVSIVDEDRIWFKSHHGLDVKEIGRDPGLCASAILAGEPRILSDARLDVFSLANPLVAGEFGLRFYAGVPLKTHDGFSLGTLCVIDREPRPVNDSEIEDLKDLASVVMDQLELRLSARQAVAHAQVSAREVEHRVMNSLQFISSLLAIQGRSATTPDMAAQLNSAANRIAAISRLNRHFCIEQSAGLADALAYLQRLCGDLSAMLGSRIEVTGAEAMITSQQIQSVGLIVNELVTNAAKHGGGAAHVRLAPTEDGRFLLSVCDQGPGLPADFDPVGRFESRGLGMKLVQALSRQLGGAVHFGNNPHGQGAVFTISFRGGRTPS